jgi:hypothetical protein
MKKTSENPHEAMCLATATHFVAVRGRQPSKRVRYDVPSLAAAKAIGAEYGDGRTMIYAVNALGNSAHICNE